METPAAPWIDPLARFEVAFRTLVPKGRKVSEETILNALARARGASKKAEIEAFKAERPPLVNPFPAIPTSEIALARIQRAITEKEKVAIIGDYDVDGTISTVLLFEFLAKAGNRPACFIPDRIEDDYGVTQKAADKCVGDHAPTLIISVDCGTTATAVIADLEQRGVDMIVIDHHEPGTAGAANPAVAHLNPKAWPGISPLATEAESLCAGALVFFFVDYLSKTIPAGDWSYDRALILAGMATVADVMPLTNTNRAIVKHSLLMANTVQGRALVPGISTLVEQLGSHEFTSRSYGWVIGPHLNAAGRVSHARLAANLIASRDPKTIAASVEELIATNRERKLIQDVVQDEAMMQAASLVRMDPNRQFLVLFGKAWHPGVVGIVAGRVRERFRLPTIVCGLHPDGVYWKGSARGIKGCELGDLVHAAVAEGVILGGGGHQAAAGVRIAVGEEENFRAWLERRTASMTWDKVDRVDAVGDYSDLPPSEWADTIKHAGPFGNSNPEPVMLIRGARPCGEPQPLTTGHGRVFGLTFNVHEAASGRDYRISWLGLSGGDELAAVENLLRRKEPITFAVRQNSRVKHGMTYLNLDIVGLPKAA